MDDGAEALTRIRNNPLYDTAREQVAEILPKQFLATFLREEEVEIVHELMTVSFLMGITWHETHH